MTILAKILSEIKTEDDVEKVRMLCDQINKEEYPNIEVPVRLPSGPNIFLALQVPGRRQKEIAYLTLEREFGNKFVIVFYTLNAIDISNQDVALKRQMAFPIEDERPEKILTSFAKTYKHYRGE